MHPLSWMVRLPAAALLAATLTLALTPTVTFAVPAGSVPIDVGGAQHARAAAAPPDLAGLDWAWPLMPVRITAPYRAPVHAYGPGHRGVDLAATSDAPVTAPAAGVVAFAGPIAGRGVLTIDHPGGLVTTLEPVVTTLPPGTPVARGDAVGMPSLGGHTAAGSIHFGVRWNGEYINPMLLLGGIPRAVLLPCC